ncbi:phage holin [Radiobacillus deserti]|uniref:Phage holin n=1 Tax=Radiobacillus deserti TaxID=2594883 RepID=A0A516KF44_9BACI|nr:phage holin [Radiobacillus deserti]QDP40000.1 hypothetical protein FN924_07365 [Radiobacillus deserti]
MDKDTLLRSFLLFAAIVNQVFVFFGHSTIPIGNPLVEQVVATIFTILSFFIVWFKINCSQTDGGYHEKNQSLNGPLKYKKTFMRWSRSLSSIQVMVGKR